MSPKFRVIAKTGEPILHLEDFWLPESPVHDEDTGTTWFTDIPRSVIYGFNVKEGQKSLKRIEVGDPVGCLALIEGDKEHLAVGAKRGFGKVNIETGKLEYINTLFPGDKDKQDLMRINDGAVDVQGRFWAGSMRSFGLGPPQNEGTLFRSDPTTHLNHVKYPVSIPNGIGFSPDNSTLYLVETRLKTIFAYRFEPETGGISHEQEFIKFDEDKHGPGAPDGLAISSDGDLWVAMLEGYKVLRIDPKTKDVKGIIEVPTSKQVACPAFVGEGMVITTGKLVHLDPDIAKTSAHAGDVFYVPLPGITGREVYKAKFDAVPEDPGTTSGKLMSALKGTEKEKEDATPTGTAAAPPEKPGANTATTVNATTATRVTGEK
ncbi:SGL-domain-containing protein [Tuber magnatum]|uniref:SGL-domain-containing protein n=1 Tax=Tuber magnatum TaxID=42249 RepID=A0A317SPM0_9PEZI|nr:SGL-domain-containing protein [Tuber magnatum]